MVAEHASEDGSRAFPVSRNNKARIAAGFVYNWCPREDSNLHGFTR